MHRPVLRRMVMSHFNNKLTVHAIPKVCPVGIVQPNAFSLLEDPARSSPAERRMLTSPKVLDGAVLQGYPQWRLGHVNMSQEE